jgi:hypothetical protein
MLCCAIFIKNHVDLFRIIKNDHIKAMPPRILSGQSEKIEYNVVSSEIGTSTKPVLCVNIWVDGKITLPRGSNAMVGPEFVTMIKLREFSMARN